MQYYRQLYHTSNIRAGELASLRRRAKRKKLGLMDFVITVDRSGTNQLVVYPSLEWNGPHVDVSSELIVGFGRGIMATRWLIADIVRDTYQATGDGDIPAYLRSQDQNFCVQRGTCL